MTALLQATLLCPWTDGALEVLGSDVVEARGGEFLLNAKDTVEIRAEGSEAIFEKAQEIAPGVRFVA